MKRNGKLKTGDKKLISKEENTRTSKNETWKWRKMEKEKGQRQAKERVR